MFESHTADASYVRIYLSLSKMFCLTVARPLWHVACRDLTPVREDERDVRLYILLHIKIRSHIKLMQWHAGLSCVTHLWIMKTAAVWKWGRNRTAEQQGVNECTFSLDHKTEEKLFHSVWCHLSVTALKPCHLHQQSCCVRYSTEMRGKKTFFSLN